MHQKENEVIDAMQKVIVKYWAQTGLNLRGLAQAPASRERKKPLLVYYAAYSKSSLPYKQYEEQKSVEDLRAIDGVF